VTHGVTSDRTLEENALSLRKLGCDGIKSSQTKKNRGKFPDKCSIQSIQYTLTKYDSTHTTVIGINVKGDPEAHWGWITIPPHTLEPGCIIYISQGDSPSNSKATDLPGKNKNKCERGKGKREEDVNDVSPSVSIRVVCDGKEVTSFPKGIKLEFLSNVPYNDQLLESSACLGFYRGEKANTKRKNDDKWSCISNIDFKRVSGTQTLFTSTTDHFTR